MAERVTASTLEIKVFALGLEVRDPLGGTTLSILTQDSIPLTCFLFHNEFAI